MHLRHEVDDARIAREIEEARVAAHAFAVVALDVRRDELLGTHARVRADQRVERVAHLRDGIDGQAELRDQPAFAMVVRDLGVAQYVFHCVLHDIVAGE